jgi:hypothetical protein
MDLVETDEDFVLRADLPGLSEQYVSVELDDTVLTISGERKSEHEERREGLLPGRALVRHVLAIAHAFRGSKSRAQGGEAARLAPLAT